MEIKQLLEMPIDYRTGGFALTCKTIKKRWQIDNLWVHQVVLTDTTGDILADIVRNSNIPFNRGSSIWIIACEIQPTETGKKLFVHEWKQESITEPPDRLSWAKEEEMGIIAGKVRHGLVCAYLQSGTEPEKDEIRKWMRFIITGE